MCKQSESDQLALCMSETELFEQHSPAHSLSLSEHAAIWPNQLYLNQAKWMPCTSVYMQSHAQALIDQQWLSLITSICHRSNGSISETSDLLIKPSSETLSEEVIYFWNYLWT